MSTPTLTTDELERRLDDAHTVRIQAEARLRRARHAAVNGDKDALAEEAGAEIALAECERQIARLQGAADQQEQIDDGEAHAARLRALATQEALFLEHLAAAEAAGELLEKSLAAYVKGFQQYTRAAIAVQQMAPALGERIRHDFSLDRPETLIGDELARISFGGRHPPGTSLHALQSQGDPTRLPRIAERIVALTGEWRANIAEAQARRGA